MELNLKLSLYIFYGIDECQFGFIVVEAAHSYVVLDLNR
jgi:hypothetical protein